ncbi:MAG TPA: cyanophycin synthetase, partial [Thermodesulfobacteriota bacterium]|nr:cyanophycin synthetase [Thermodesulfobacteriota bacterium]
KCRRAKSSLHVWERDFRGVRAGRGLLNYLGMRHRWMGLQIGLRGRHQTLNASLALAAAELLTERGFPIGDTELRSGLAKTRWPGRLELIEGAPRVILDGAHNAGAAAVLKSALRSDFPRRRLILVLGIMADKDIAGMMARLVPMADLVILTRPRMARAAEISVLRAHAAPFGRRVVEIQDVPAAVDAALDEGGTEDLVVVTGSLFTVGEARGHLVEKGTIPKNEA